MIKGTDLASAICGHSVSAEASRRIAAALLSPMDYPITNNLRHGVVTN
jgi:hypothetical protein